MSTSALFLSPAEAAQRLGVSAKALRLYEQRGLITPLRTAAGWRAYGPDEMQRASEIVALRALGFSLMQVARVLKGDPRCLESALGTHRAMLEGQMRQLAGRIETLRSLSDGLARGQKPTVGELTRLIAPASEVQVAFDLPWPWGGERFELRDIRPLNYIIGPLGSGKTRLAQCLARALPDAAFLGLERQIEGGVAAQERLQGDAALKIRVDRTMAWLVEDGATESDALTSLITWLETEEPSVLVIDMIEQGLDQGTQEALIAHLRRRGSSGKRLFILTRSCAILDLTAVGDNEAIILCPANHSPPVRVPPYPGAPGYEAVATCLASPEVRARTEGVIAWRPHAGTHVS
ncbi:MerR family transcriptional regulator [Microvirga rosea]|uniref:MerR family transcriptional regulator n=1 Tax=Microvirga rosea TaxID=2715425 RepID=UPI001D0B2116|nr:MerR family transcriptional regulator [Microvirga rosea]MCB8819779.1 MerR family transcriptional regulator [Microvirga rosea]